MSHLLTHHLQRLAVVHPPIQVAFDLKPLRCLRQGLLIRPRCPYGVNLPIIAAGVAVRAQGEGVTHDIRGLRRGLTEARHRWPQWLFPSLAARSGHTTDIQKAFRRAVIAAGLDPDKVVRHTLRHTAITHLVQAGVDLPTVKRISRHKTLSMVERYAHQNGAHIHAAMDKLEERYTTTG